MYAIAPLQNFDLSPVRQSGSSARDLFNMIICSNSPFASDNMCFYFSRFNLLAAEEHGLQEFLSQSFSVDALQVLKAEIREDFIVLGFGSKDVFDSKNNMIKVYSTHNDLVQMIHQVGPG